jgi:23S rRNA (cytosine1962-C5)-methyltransferase
MKLRYFEENDIIFVDKPAGISTHSPDTGKVGTVEIYQRELGIPLFVVHRLDKTTSGALIFAKSAKKAEELVDLFRNHQIKKKYWFLTDRNSEFSENARQSHIEKRGKAFVSENSPTANAETRFTRIKRSPFFELWEAEPLTGKPHQIRLHASDLGIPVLGDTLYGGTEFPHLCLHSMQIEIPGAKIWNCPPPRFFERLGLLRDPELVRILSAIDLRQRLYGFLGLPKAALRLSHLESRDLRLDLLGSVLWGQWYNESAPTDKDLRRMEFLQSLLSRPFVLRKMNNRGKDPTTKLTWTSDPPPPESWIAEENNLRFEFHRERGLSSGLFLDQRQNRQWVFKNSRNRKVLNLFAYTCGFSVAAAKGGAAEVVSVDVSQDFLNWGQRNFQINEIDPTKFEFFKQDSVFFLEACAKRKRQFDLVICDPPTFGRHKEGVFKFEKDWKSLLEKISNCLTPKGFLLFCHNYEEWSPDDFRAKIRALGKWDIQTDIPRGLDYERPNSEPLMKHLLLQKK